MSSKALILIDFEKEWIDPASEDYVGDISDVLKKTNDVIDYCRSRGDKIIFTRHVEPKADKAWAEGSKGTELIDTLHKDPSDIVITKQKISPFYQTTLEWELKGVSEVIVCGILTNLCVRSLVQDAYDRDFDITVIKDCCVAFDEETQNFTLRDLQATREGIQFKDAEEFIK